MMILKSRNIVSDASSTTSIDYALIAGFISFVIVVATGEIGATLITFSYEVAKGFL